MVNIEEIIQRLALPPQDLEIQKGKNGIDLVKLRLVGDDIALSSFSTISKKITQEFGEAAEMNDSNRERSWRWDIDGIGVHLYLFEQHCYKLALTIH